MGEKQINERLCNLCETIDANAEMLDDTLQEQNKLLRERNELLKEQNELLKAIKNSLGNLPVRWTPPN